MQLFTPHIPWYKNWDCKICLFILGLTLVLTFLWFAFFLPAVFFPIYYKWFLLGHSCPEVGAFEGRVDTQLYSFKWSALFTWGLLNNKKQKSSTGHLCGFHNLSSADCSVLSTAKDKTLTADCNKKAVSLCRSLLCKQLILVFPRK